MTGIRAARRWAASSAGVLVLAAAWLTPALGADTVVYKNNFDAQPGTPFPEWTSSPIRFDSRYQPPGSGTLDAPAVTNVESPNKRRRFLGEFGGPRLDPTARTRVRQSVRLKLKNLPAHSRVTVAFDLLILRSWDGSSPQYGPDRWALRVEGGPTLLDTTFSNNPKLDSDRSYQDYPRPKSQPQAGAAAVKRLDSGFFGDSAYHLQYTFPHAADTLVLEFASDLFEGKGTADEAWGLDDVQVRVGNDQPAKPAAGTGKRPPSGASRQRRLPGVPLHAG